MSRNRKRNNSEICYCGIPYREHPRCDGCGILAGPGHMVTELIEYRGKRLCRDCLQVFQAREEEPEPRLSPAQQLWLEVFGPQQVPEIEPSKLRKLLAGLPERQKVVVELYFGLAGEKLPLRAISERLGVSKETARMDLAKAINWLRQHKEEL